MNKEHIENATGCSGPSSSGCTVNACTASITGDSYGLSQGRHRGWAALLLAHARATERVGRQVESEGGLPLDWYDVLLALEYAPEGRLRMGELAEHVTLSRSGLTRLIDRIEAAGLVERHLCPSDRRAFEASITAKGRAERASSWPIYARAIAEVLAPLTDAEAQQLAGWLDLVRLGDG